MNIILTGMPFSGKTTIGKRLSEELNYQFVDSDDLITKSFGDIGVLFSKGEKYFRDVEYQVISNIKGDNLVVAVGGGAITQKRTLDYLNNLGVTVFLDVAIDTLLERADFTSRPLIKCKDDLIKLYNDRVNYYNKASLRVLPKSVDETVDAIITMLF